MKSLAHLPSEVLAQIVTQFDSTVPLLVLWKCGDSVLNAKLASGVEQVELRDVSLVSISRYPMMISSLKNLRSLWLDRGKYSLTKSCAQLIGELNKIAGDKLETLRIESAESDHFFRELRSPSTTHDLPSHPSPSLPTDIIYNSSNLFAKFQRLTTLQIHRQLSPQILEENDLSLLPNSLTHLDIPIFTCTFMSGPVFSKLPRSLLIWKTQFEYNDLRSPPPSLGGVSGTNGGDPSTHEDHLFSNDASSASESFDQWTPSAVILQHIWSNPPPLLHTVWTFALENIEQLDLFDYLPRTITECDLDVNGFAWTPSHFQSLPPNFKFLFLEELDLVSFTGSIWTASLPEKLKHLDCGLIGSSIDLSIPDLAHLPRSLESFHAHRFQRASLDWAVLEATFKDNDSFWPPGLTTLDLSFAIPKEHFYAIPKTLTKLLTHWCEEGGSNFECLPECLLELRLILSSVNNVIDVHSLPKGLKTLEMRPAREGIVINDKTVDFPPSLTELELKSSRQSTLVGQGRVFPLPSSLKSLRLDGWRWDWFDRIPRSATSFSSHLMVFPPDGSVDDGTGDGFNLAQGLPEGLRRLVLHPKYRDESRRCSHLSFSHLPHLVEIDVPYLGVFPCSVLAHMPPTLKKLGIRLENFVTDFAPHLNPRLTKFFVILIDKSNIRSLAEHWPPEADTASLMGFPEEIEIALQRLRHARTLSASFPATNLI